MKNLILLFLAFLVLSCNNESSLEHEDKIMNEQEMLISHSPASPVSGSENLIDSNRKIILSANLTIETDSIISVQKKIKSSLKNLKGYIEEEEQSTDLGYQNLTVKCKIPAQSFDVFIQNLDKVGGKIGNKNIKRLDVSREYIETETTINAKKALQKRYIELLAKATKVSDMLEIENKLNEIQKETDFSIGYLNSLQKQIKYSNVEIQLISKTEITLLKPSFGKDISTAFSNGYNLLKNLVLGLIVLWPVWIILIIVILIYKKYYKRKTKQG